MEPPPELRLLESNNPDVVEAAKKKFHEYFNSTKESWLLNGMVDYCVATTSLRCVDILVCVREPHDNYFFNKMTESLRNSPATRLNVLTLLSHVVVRQPTWLYKIAQHNLFKELLKVLKTETDIVNLMSALLTLVILLPMIPAYVGSTLQDIFEVFSRLAAWNTNNPNKLQAEQLVHLQISLHFLFHRLYGMYPCNFLSFLRQQYGAREHLAVFSHTIKPMLDTVKMHPLLVTTSKETETTTTRWKTMEHHDVVVECAKLSIDSKDENIVPAVANFRARSESELRRLMESSGYQDLKAVHNHTMELKDLWSPGVDIKPTTPPLPALESTAPTSIPLTPVSQQSYAVSYSYPHQIGTSPPEAAVEATPETTPVKDPRQYASARPPPVNSSVVRALNQLGTPKWNSSTSTPNSSQPSSPMKKDISPFRFPEQSHESKMFQRKIQAIVQDRQNSSAAERNDSVNGVKSPVVKKHAPEACSEDQEDLEVLEISQQGEMSICSQSTSAPRQCDSVLQDFHPAHNEDIEHCEHDSGSPCPAGGLHMANSRSMSHFREKVRRLRYYSQCGADAHGQPVTEMGGSEPKGDFSLSLQLQLVRRVRSCPEIKKETPPFTGPDSGDEHLDETLELETTTATTGTQTAVQESPILYPYEHLFLALFPPVPATASVSDVDARQQFRSSPTMVLDQYLDTAALRKTIETAPLLKRSVSVLESELKTVKDQLVLLHLQLKFERHRRDCHAERNRRLLGKSRTNRLLEEHNSALRDQLALLERDIDSLRQEIEKKKEEYRVKEKKTQEDKNYWQERCTNIEKQNGELKSENQALVIELHQKKESLMTNAKKLQQVESMLFSVGKELREATAQATAGEVLKVQVVYLQKDLMLMGEQNGRYRAQLGRLSMRSGQHKQLYQDCYQDQVRSLSSQVDQKTTSCETLKSRVAELESLLARKDMHMAEQKRALKAVKEECREKLEAVEVKYKSQIATNRKLESHVLELTSKLEAVGRRPRRNVSAAQDVLSLAERGGMNSPLSLSLSSSEGLSLSSTLTTDVPPPRDLQAVVDAPPVSRIPEMPEFDDLPGPSGSDN